MTRVAKITYLSSLLLGLLAGVLFGFRMEAEQLPFDEMGSQMAATQAVDDFGRTQFHYADPENAAKALQLSVNVLEQIEKRNPEVTQQQALVTAYVRLAILADGAANPAQSQAYMTKAQEWHKSLLLAHDVSDAQLKANVTLADRLRQP
jgi:hypothetical protein